MRASYLLLIANVSLFGSVADFTVVGTTPTQAVVTFAVPDPTQCTLVVYEDAGRTLVAHDTDATLFAGAASCNRSGNVVSGQDVTAVLGTRTVVNALDGKAYSRALEQDKTYWVTITDTANSSPFGGQFTTTRIPFGQTWNDPLPAVQPWISPTDAAQTIIDPHTGARLHRLTLAKDLTSQQGLTFGAPAAAVGWSGTANLLADDTQAALVSGSTSAIFIPDTDGNIAGNGGSHGKSWGADTASGLNAFNVTLNAWCSSSSCAAATSDDRALQVALSVDGGITAATNWLDIPTASCASNCTSGNRPTAGGTTPLLADWISGAQPGFDVSQLPARSGNCTVTGNVVTWSGGAYYFPTYVSPGAAITIAGTTYTIASVNTDRQITLTSAATAGGTWSIQPFGLMLRKKTPSAEQIQVQFVTATLTSSPPPGWDQAGTAQGNVSCSPVPVSGPTGKGVHCWAAPTLYWVDTTTGQRTFQGVAKLPYNGNTDGWNSLWCTSLLWDPTDGNRAYCFVGGYSNLIAMEYSGNNTDVGTTDMNTPLAACGTAPCWTFTNLVPASQNKTLLQQFTNYNAQTAAFVAEYGAGIDFATVEGNDLEFFARPAAADTNDMYSWEFLFRPSSASIVAATPPDRWSGLHGGTASGFPGWAVLPDEGLPGTLSGADRDGAGPFMAVVQAQMTPTTTIACPPWNPSTGIAQSDWPSGNKCAVLTTNGQPYDPTPGPHEPAGSPKIGNQSGYYRYDAAPGDLICIVASTSLGSYGNSNYNHCAEDYQSTNGRDGEYLRILAVNSNTSWTVQRGYFGPGSNNTPRGFRDHEVGDVVFMLPVGCNIGMPGSPYACISASNGWNYAEQPNGPTSDKPDYKSNAAGHGFNSNGWAVAALSTNTPTVDGDGYWAYNVRAGATVTDQSQAPNQLMANDAPFQGFMGEGSPNGVDSHPSCVHCPVDNTWFSDMRPFLGDASFTSCAAASGALLKCTSSRLRRKYLPTLAIIGEQVLTDVSGPGSAISGNVSDAGKYCIAVLAGECQGGSHSNDLFVNAGQSSQTGCTAMGVGNLDADLPSICVGDNGAFTQGMTQVRLKPPDTTGAQVRLITHGLSRYFWVDQFWNAKTMTDGSWALLHSRWAGPRGEAFLVKIPPINPSQVGQGDPAVRPEFQKFPVNVPASGQVGARVRFGYDAGFHCTSDSDSCVTGGTPWSYSREAPAPAQCAKGCTITVPAIPEHPLYYRVELTDANGNTIKPYETRVAIPSAAPLASQTGR